MTHGFAPIPAAPAYRLCDARVPIALAHQGGIAADREGFAHVDVTIAGGKILSIVPHGGFTLDGDLPAVALGGGIVLPRLIDIHTHLDKGHIWPRRPNPDGTFMGALGAAGADREAHWSAEDVRRRMDFALRCAYAHGTGAVRTHLDSIGPQTAISWPVFDEMRAQWAGRIALQAVSLFVLPTALTEPERFREVVETTARHGGVLGGVTFLGEAPDGRTDAALDLVFEAAAANGLDLDFHVDESDSEDARTLERIADAAIRHRFRGKIVAGHCCSLALMNDEDARRTIAKVAEARIAVVSLPMCNMYLQDRRRGRTPLLARGRAAPRARDRGRARHGGLRQHPRSVLRLWRPRHAGGPARGDPHPPAGSRRPRLIRAVACTPADIMGLDRLGRSRPGTRPISC
jgi:cytosine deaminase